jgi:hypothetical protein
MSRVILIAWNGADWRIRDPLLEQGGPAQPPGATRQGTARVPALHRPTHSWSAWPSFLTGVDPDDHGASDILVSMPGTHKHYPVAFSRIKARTFLGDLTAAGKKPAPARSRSGPPTAAWV